MKYKAPEVEEEHEEDDVTSAPKRKRGDEETPVVQEKIADETESQPPSKAARAGEVPDEQEDVDEEFLNEGGSDEDGLDQEELDGEDFDEDLSDLGDEESEEMEEAEPKKGTSQKKSGQPLSGEKLKKTIEKYGHGPLEGTAIEEKALTGSADTILAMLIDAMLKSKPLSHELTDRTLRKLVDVGYHDIQKLGDASWEERATVLKDGGYNRYREQGSTNLGKLVEFVNENYGGYPRSLNVQVQLLRANSRLQMGI